jgi:GTP pyrophosphokinase
MVKLNYQLRAGDSMEILTRPDQQPSKDWVHMVHTSRALSKIRTWLKKEERDRAEELGEKMLDQELRRFERSLKAVLKQDELKRAVDATNQHAAEDLYREIGFGRIEPRKIVALYVDSEKIQAAMEEPRGEEAGTNTLTGLFKRLARRGGSPVRIDGVEGMLTIFAKCCRPLPGDPVLGFITRGRGITVHASDCKQALALPRERRIEVEWDTSHKVPHAARIRVVTVDRPMMLADLTRAIGKMNVNITSAEARTTREERGHIMLEVAVTDAAQLRQVMSDLTRLKGVISVDRMRA